MNRTSLLCFTVILSITASIPYAFSTTDPSITNSDNVSAAELKSNDKDAITFYEKAYKMVKSKEFDAAIDLYNKAIEIDPNFAPAFTNRGNVHMLKGSLKEAIKDHNTAIKIDRNFARAYFNRGSVYKNLYKYRKALKDYSKAIQLNPEYGRAYAHRGETYQKLNQVDNALNDYNMAIELNFDDSNTYYNRGVIYLEKRIKDHGEADFIKSAELDCKNFQAFYNLACLYSMKKDAEKTYFYLNKAREAGFNELDFLKRDPDMRYFRKTTEYKRFINSF